VRTYSLSLMFRPIGLLAFSLVLMTSCFAGNALRAQVPDRITQDVNPLQVRPLANHLPQWATAANDAGVAPGKMNMDGLTMVLTRSPEREVALGKLLADQQNPTSPEYRHWLTPAEIGERFGLSEQDIRTLTGWLQSQGLRVNWVSPSRIFIGFSGTAAEIGHAFQTEVHQYKVNGAERLSISSAPLVPNGLAPAIKAIHGLYTIDERPLHEVTPVQNISPDLTLSNGEHFLAPADFATIYDVPSSLDGNGTTIGIVGRSRTDFADFENFLAKSNSNFLLPTEVIPTAFGGVDPGPAFTAPPGPGVSTGDQGEATLDVLRAGSVAGDANLLLVVATAESGGIGTDAQYLVQTSPIPAQIMTISFGACELNAGKSGVDYWDTLFEQAAAEGISSFVSSGDAGASGCDTNFAIPPAAPLAKSINYICASSYATCVGGSEFNDANASAYWSASNGTNLSSALSYIPEGGWNEPLSSNSAPQAASSGGGVSAFIATPSWQTGSGVPAARAGRYTPDIAFSASCYDGYFACFAAGGADCVTQANGSFSFLGFCGTSAAAPGMAGVAALLDQTHAAPQGNLNPEIYRLAASAPAAFHDVTVASSGVADCSVNTPSMCNNSVPGPTGITGGQAGYLVTTGYDEVTGLGSLDVQTFLESYVGTNATPTLSITTSPAPSTITTAQQVLVNVTVNELNSITPTGTATLTCGSYTSPVVSLSNGSAEFIIPAETLPTGNGTLTVKYTPDTSGAANYNSSSASIPITVTAVSILTPTVYLGSSSSSITTAQTLFVAVNATQQL
jgi:pseudomonalisin